MVSDNHDNLPPPPPSFPDRASFSLISLKASTKHFQENVELV